MDTNFWAATSQDQFESPKDWDIFPVQQLRAGTSSDKMQGLSCHGLYASDGDLLVAQQLSQAPWAAPALRSDPVRVQRMETCICCLWILLLCKLSVAIPWRKLYVLEGLTQSLYMFAITEVALVCHGHAGRSAWGEKVVMSKGSQEAAILVRIRFCTSRLAEKACCGLLQKSSHRRMDSRSEAGWSWGWLDTYSGTRSHGALGTFSLSGIRSSANFLSKCGQINSSSVLWAWPCAWVVRDWCVYRF